MNNEEQQRHEKHIRWQEIRVTQFGYVNYLILTLASGALVFGISPLTDSNGCSGALCSSTLYWCTLFFLLISVVAGIVCAYVRLCDFRDTAKVAEYYHDGQKNYTDPGKRLKDGDEATSLRQTAEKFGQRSWWLLQIQITSLAPAIVSFIIAITKANIPCLN